MVGNNHLQVRGKVANNLEYKGEHPADRCAVFILDDVKAPVDVALGRIIDLGWLIEENESWYRSLLLNEVLMKGQVGDEVVADPVLSAPHSVHRHGPRFLVRDNRQ